MVKSELAEASAWKANRALHARFKPVGRAISYSDVRGAVERRKLAQGTGIVDEFADRYHARPTAAACSAQDGNTGTEVLAAVLLDDFLIFIGRGWMITMRVVGAGQFIVNVGLRVMVSRLLSRIRP